MAQQTLKGRVREDFIAKYSYILQKSSGDKAEVAAVIRTILESILSQPRGPLKQEERDNIINELVDEFSGFGPIEKLMMDPDITEIMVNGPNEVYVERAGRLHLSNVKFKDEAQLSYYLEKILSPVGRRVSEI